MTNNLVAADEEVGEEKMLSFTSGLLNWFCTGQKRKHKNIFEGRFSWFSITIEIKIEGDNVPEYISMFDVSSPAQYNTVIPE